MTAETIMKLAVKENVNLMASLYVSSVSNNDIRR